MNHYKDFHLDLIIMQFQPSYIDLSDLVLTEFRDWINLSCSNQVIEQYKGAMSQFDVSVSPNYQSLHYQYFAQEDFSSQSKSSIEQEDIDEELYTFSEYQDQYSWEEEFNEYGDVINKLFVQKKSIKLKNQKDQSTHQDQFSRKNQLFSDNESFSQKNIKQNLEQLNFSKLRAQSWWKENRKDKVARYFRKKQRRSFTQNFSYNCRKAVAGIRLRIKGKFIGKSQAQQLLNESLKDMSNDEIKERLNQYYKHHK